MSSLPSFRNVRCLAGLRHRAGLVELALHLPQLLALPPLPPSLERLDLRCVAVLR